MIALPTAVAALKIKRIECDCTIANIFTYSRNCSHLSCIHTPLYPVDFLFLSCPSIAEASSYLACDHHHLWGSSSLTLLGCRIVLQSWVVDYMMLLHPPCLRAMCQRAYFSGYLVPFTQRRKIHFFIQQMVFVRVVKSGLRLIFLLRKQKKSNLLTQTRIAGLLTF